MDDEREKNIQEAEVVEEEGAGLNGTGNEGPTSFLDDIGQEDPASIADEARGDAPPGSRAGNRSEEDAHVDPTKFREVDEDDPEPTPNDGPDAPPDPPGYTPPKQKKEGRKNPHSWQAYHGAAYLEMFAYEGLMIGAAKYAKGLEQSTDQIEEDFSMGKKSFDRAVYGLAMKNYSEGKPIDWGKTLNKMLRNHYLPKALELIPGMIARGIYDYQKITSYFSKTKEEPPKPPKTTPQPEEEEDEGKEERPKKGKKEGKKKAKKGDDDGRGRPKNTKKNKETGRYERAVDNEDAEDEEQRIYSWEISESKRRRWLKKMSPDDPKRVLLIQYDDPAVRAMIDVNADPDYSQEERKKKLEELKKKLRTWKQLERESAENLRKETL